MLTIIPVTPESAAQRAKAASEWATELADLIDRMPALIGFRERNNLRAALCVIRLDVERAGIEADKASGLVDDAPGFVSWVKPWVQQVNLPVAEAVYEDIKRGDEEHRRWLEDQLKAFYERHPECLPESEKRQR